MELAIVFTFAFLSAVFFYLAERPLKNYSKLRVLFHFLGIVSLFVLLTGASLTFEKAKNCVVANKTVNNTWGYCDTNGSSIGTFSNTTYNETTPCVISFTESYEYECVDYSTINGILVSASQIIIYLLIFMMFIYVIILTYRAYKEVFPRVGSLFDEDDEV